MRLYPRFLPEKRQKQQFQIAKYLYTLYIYVFYEIRYYEFRYTSQKIIKQADNCCTQL